MPLEGVDLTCASKLLTFEEQKRTISIFSNLGMTKMRFTGGEPTLNKKLPDLIRHARSYSSCTSVGITTNGLVLLNQLDSLVEAGLTSVNVSLDTLKPEKFAKIARREAKGLLKVMASIYGALAMPKLSVKVNIVLMRGTNDDELGEFLELTKHHPLDCRFIELMPFDGNEWSREKFIGYIEAIDRLKQQGIELIKCVEEDPNDTTKWYRIPGYQGRVGFITSMTSHFCGTCNRLRVTADGKLKVCLFGDEGLSLVDSYREGCTDEDVTQLINGTVKKKKAVLGGHDTPEALAKVMNRPMILIGG